MKKGWILLLVLLIYINFVGASIISITNDIAEDRNPQVYGDKIVYQKYTDSTHSWDIYMYDISIGSTTTIANSGYDETNPDIFNNYIVYESRSSSDYVDLFLYNINTKNKQRIAYVATYISSIPAYPQIYNNYISYSEYCIYNLDNYLGYWCPKIYNITGNFNYNPCTTPTLIPKSFIANQKLKLYDKNIIWMDRWTAQNIFKGTISPTSNPIPNTCSINFTDPNYKLDFEYSDLALYDNSYVFIQNFTPSPVGTPTKSHLILRSLTSKIDLTARWNLPIYSHPKVKLSFYGNNIVYVNWSSINLLYDQINISLLNINTGKIINLDTYYKNQSDTDIYEDKVVWSNVHGTSSADNHYDIFLYQPDYICEIGEEETKTCGVSNIGACKLGTQTRICLDRISWNEWGICSGSIDPVVEICDDSIDNNCDGKTDCSDSACSTAGNCICIDVDNDGYGVGQYRSTCANPEVDCNDNDANIHPNVIEIPNNNIDDNCNDLVDESCTDICAGHNNDISNKEQNCRGDSQCNCYFLSSSGSDSCLSCEKTNPVCTTFSNLGDCQGQQVGPNKCGRRCSWDSSLNTCSSAGNCPITGDADGDSVCDGDEGNGIKDNCPPIAGNLDGWNNPYQEDSNLNGIGDACDAETIGNNCSSMTIDEVYCLQKKGDSTQKCSVQNGNICGSNQDCISGYMIKSADSANSKCCIIGFCGTTTFLLSGTSQKIVDVTSCINPNEQGIGKKMVQKYDANMVEIGPKYEVDCTVLPESTVPFYSLISSLITILILVGFYMFRRK